MSTATPSIVYATQAGGMTVDCDELGGNPFASALIELTSARNLEMRRLLPELEKLSFERSQGFQRPAWSLSPELARWRLSMAPGAHLESRESLVLVVSDYSAMGITRLDGAALDERRISALLAKNGFNVMQGITPTRLDMLRALAVFRRRTLQADVAILYSTGHGIHRDGKTYLLPGDYPLSLGYSRKTLQAHAIPVDRLCTACAANAVNITFFAGCRTVPSP